ncbi:MAG: DUF2284 domain-containing protein [Ruminococcus sp.]|jgi:predicted metal-binding protein
MKQFFEDLAQKALDCGAYKAQVIGTDEIVFDEGLRKACEANYCGNYGRNYACPPNVGEPEELIREAKSYAKALVFQTVTQIEDSYDIEGMMEAAENHSKTADKIEKMVSQYYPEYLQLTAGKCDRCKVCAQITGEPCRMPQKAISSVEAYCMNCSQLAAASGMLYINGQNTVTYFGMFLLPEAEIDG